MEGDFRVGEWLVLPRLNRITTDGRTVSVRAKVMDLLVFMAGRPDDVLSKNVLLNGVWGTEALSESALTRSITDLRQALGDSVEHPSYIETITKRGYRLIASVSPVSTHAVRDVPPACGAVAGPPLTRLWPARDWVLKTQEMLRALKRAASRIA